jgi:hypothetical protein
MENIFEIIINHFNENDLIPLDRQGYFYKYVEISSTRINGEEFQSITYEISLNNQKRITRKLIEETYKYYRTQKDFPDINWYRREFTFEIKSRPCNKSVAKRLIMTIINAN